MEATVLVTLNEDLGTGTGNPVLHFQLKVGYPIYIFDTQVGHGVTSVFNDGAVVSTGTTCLDNICVDDINPSIKPLYAI